MFFNAPYFKQQAQAAMDAASPGLKWFVLDALPLTQVDVTPGIARRTIWRRRCGQAPLS